MEDVERKNYKRSQHPKEAANWFSSLFFCWVFPTFFKGLKKDFTEEDLFSTLPSHDSKNLGKKLQQAWDLEKLEKSKPSLQKALIKVYYKEFLFYAFFLVLQDSVVKLGQPLFIGKLLDYYTPNKNEVTKTEAYLYSFGIILLSFFDIMFQHSSFFGLQQLSMKMQVACRCVIYRKALKMSKGAVAESTVGQIVNLISNDVSRFQYLCLHLHQVFIAPLQTMIVLYLLFVTVDKAAIVGVGFMITTIPLLMVMGKLMAKYRSRIAKKTDSRLLLMNEIISGIQIIKMYSWERPFAKLVEIARRMEICEIKTLSYVRTLYLSTSWFLIPISMFFAILTYIMTGNTLQAHFVYVTASFYGAMRQPLTFHLPRCVATLAEVAISLNRIETFLLKEEVKVEHNPVPDFEDIGVFMENVNVKWSTNSDSFTLKEICLKIGKGLTAVVGRVGSGKTTLLSSILRETFLETGSLNVKGTVSYASQEPWLFSSSIRQNILFGQGMNEMRYQKVIEVCALQEDFLLLPFGDRTMVGERGVMLSGGQKARISLARAIYKDADIYLLDDPLSAVDAIVGKKIFEECIRGYLGSKCVMLVTHQLQYLGNVAGILVMENGMIKAKGSYQELKTLDGDFKKLLQELEETEDEVKKNKEGTGKVSKKLPEKELPNEVKEHESVGKVSIKVYLQYLKNGGGFCFIIFVLLMFVLTQLSDSLVEYFLAYWINTEQRRLTEPENNFLSSMHFLSIYGFLVFFLTLMVIIRSVCFTEFSMKAANRLHDCLFENIVFTTMRFFNTNSSGRILNRFSKDISIIDEQIPTFFTESLQMVLNVIAISIIVICVNFWLVIPTIFVFCLFYWYKFIYLTTSRNVKRVESRLRSPIYGHFTASLQGLSTIRAFNAEGILESEFARIHDSHNSAFFLFLSCSRAFGMWLDVNCIIYVALVILSFLIIGTETYGGNVGLAITQSISLTGLLQKGIRQFSELENQMTSVERIIEYTELPPEIDEGRKIPPKSWPQEGNITFSKVSMQYYDEGQYVLKNLTFNINSKEKIGIVGRTGAGKSSLISALFRLSQIHGRILIDDIDISTIPLAALRSQIAIIPQEPVLFSGPLRKNLDPFDEYGDEELWKALDEVEMKKAISNLAGGLSTKLSEGGSNFSVGEKQLLCLARAIVRKNNILVMDEATANVDLQTDELIQKTIREKFGKCTVLTVAHRLNTVMDSDRILVLDAGEIVQFGSPWLLLQDEGGVFYSLVRQTGKAMAEKLGNIAQENYKRSYK